VSGGDPSNLLYVYSDNTQVADPGFLPQRCDGSSTGCSTTVRVPVGGVYRFTVSVRNGAGEFTNRTVDTTVPTLSRPTVPVGQLLTRVDMFAIGPRTFSWSHPGPGHVRITKPGSFAPLPTTFPATGSFTVSAEDLPLGRTRWLVQYCEGTGSERICSDSTVVGFLVGPARFHGPERRFVAQGTALSLSWSGSGNFWYVSDPQLGPNPELVQTDQWTFPATAAPGVHNVTLVSCNFGPVTVCSDRVDITTTVAGAVHFGVADGGLIAAGMQAGTVTPPGGSPVPFTSPRNGLFHPLVAEGATVAAGAAVGWVETGEVDTIEVVVGSESTATWTTRDWESDFTALTSSASERRVTGDALDLAFGPNGDIWQLGEFSTAIAHLSGTTLTHVSTPLSRTGTTNPLTPTRPHRSALGGGLSPSSDLGEKVVTGADAVWFTHGGGGLSGPGNHSRIIRVALDVADSPATPFDDRVCAIHVPGDNNQVLGASWDPVRGRLWFPTQDLPVSGGGSAAPALCSFPDDGTAATLSNPAFPGCDNQLDYGNAAAVQAASTANLCSATVTTACMRRIPLPAGAGLPSHLELDTNGTTTAADDLIWWVDYNGRSLGRHTIASGALLCFGLPPAHSVHFFRGFPWQLRISDNHVYLGEFRDSELVRFDKAGPGPSTDCTTSPPPSPAMSEIHVPVASEDNRLHSIEVDDNRLWFTLGNENNTPLDRQASTFGYIDLASWAAGTPTGVIYNGLETLGEQSADQHHSFRGIDISPTGQIALADMHQDQITRLTPR